MSPYWYLPESDFIVECFSHFCPLPLYCLIIRDCCILFYFHVSGVKSAISLSHVNILNMLRKASSVNRQTWATSRVQMFTLCCPPYVDSFFLFFFFCSLLLPPPTLERIPWMLTLFMFCWWIYVAKYIRVYQTFPSVCRNEFFVVQQ